MADVEAASWAERTLAGITLERKIGQVVFSSITGDYMPEGDGKLQNWIRLRSECDLDGIVAYRGTPRDIAALLNRCKEAAQVPVRFASDSEGGPGQQVRRATEFPANMAFAAVGSEKLIYRAAEVAGLEVAVGIRLTCSPVVDISTEPINPSETVRTFGEDVELVSKLVRSNGEGNYNGTVTLWALMKNRGVRLRHWQSGIRVGAVRSGPALYTTFEVPGATDIQFDYARHRRVLNLDKNYVRLNDLPEWYTVDENCLYRCEPRLVIKSSDVLGSELTEGHTTQSREVGRRASGCAPLGARRSGPES